MTIYNVCPVDNGQPYGSDGGSGVEAATPRDAAEKWASDMDATDGGIPDRWKATGRRGRRDRGEHGAQNPMDSVRRIGARLSGEAAHAGTLDLKPAAREVLKDRVYGRAAPRPHLILGVGGSTRKLVRTGLDKAQREPRHPPLARPLDKAARRTRHLERAEIGMDQLTRPRHVARLDQGVARLRIVVADDERLDLPSLRAAPQVLNERLVTPRILMHGHAAGRQSVPRDR